MMIGNKMTLLPSPPNCKLYVSQIIDNLSDLAHIFGADTERVVNYAQRHFKSEYRRYEWLTIRAMLLQTLGSDVAIEYTAEGKPHLIGKTTAQHSLSISHSKANAALLLSEQPHVGVDIEQISTRILSLAHRIAQFEELPADFSSMTESEQANYLTVIWTIKEAVYKSLPCQQGVDLLTDISVTPFCFNDKPFIVAVEIKRIDILCHVHCQRFCDNVVSTVTLPLTR